MIDVAAEQRRLYPTPVTPRTRQEYRRVARWWEIEALRDYPSTADSLRYAQNLRWAAELAGLFGWGTFEQLSRRHALRLANSPRSKTLGGST